MILSDTIIRHKMWMALLSMLTEQGMNVYYK